MLALMPILQLSSCASCLHKLCTSISFDNVSCCAQKFAEKPKGKELDEMKVDTTVLGKSVTCDTNICS